MKSAGRRDAFSLVEVVVATGIFAFAILALVGVYGRLLPETRTGEHTHTAQVIALTRDWLLREAVRDFNGRRAQFVAEDSVVHLYVYAWAEMAEVRWKVGQKNLWLDDIERAQAGRGYFNSATYRVALRYEGAPHLHSTVSGAFCPLRAEIKVAPAVDPGAAIEGMEGVLDAAPRLQTFFVVFHR